MSDDKTNESTLESAMTLEVTGPPILTKAWDPGHFTRVAAISVVCDCDLAKPVFEVSQTFDPPMHADDYPRVKPDVVIATTFAAKCPTCGLWVLVDASSGGEAIVRKARLVEVPR